MRFKGSRFKGSPCKGLRVKGLRFKGSQFKGLPKVRIWDMQMLGLRRSRGGLLGEGPGRSMVAAVLVFSETWWKPFHRRGKFSLPRSSLGSGVVSSGMYLASLTENQNEVQDIFGMTILEHIFGHSPQLHPQVYAREGVEKEWGKLDEPGRY